MADNRSCISKRNGLNISQPESFDTRTQIPILFKVNGDNWPSDDSNDSDFVVKPKMAQRNRLDDSAIEGDSSGFEEKSDVSQCVPSDGQESQDSGTEVKTNIPGVKEKPKELVESPHTNNNVKSHSKGSSHQNWVISVPNGAPTEKGIMTIKFKLGDKINPKRGRKRKNQEIPIEIKEVKEKKVRIKKDKKHPTKVRVKKKSSKSVSFKESEEKLEQDTEELKMYNEKWSNQIPENILIKIFKYAIRREGTYIVAHRVSQVCKRWEIVSKSDSLWYNVDFSADKINNKRDLNEVTLKKLSEEFMSETKVLNLSGWEKHLSPLGIKAIANNCPKLTTVNLSLCSKVNADSIRILADACPNLSNIDLSSIAQHSSVNSPLSNSCLKYLFEKCGHQLTHLILSENSISNFSPAFKSIAELCKNLIVLDASNMSSLSSSLVLPLEQLQQGCPKLKVLRLANSNAALAPASLSLQAQAPGFPELEELSIAVTKEYSSWLGDNDLERLVKASHKLKLLDVRGCRSISVSGLVKVPAWDIEHLHLSQCAATKTTDLELILKKWSHSLKEVDLSWANNTDAIDQGVTSLTSTEGESKLEILDLRGSSVSLFSIRNILENCKLLHTLNLQSCRALPRGIKRLYVGEDLDRLREELIEGKFDDNASGVAKSDN